MQAQFLRRFFAPTAIILAFAVSTFLATIAATASEVPEVRCQDFNGRLSGFNYQRAPSILGETASGRHVITTGVNTEAQRLHAWTEIEPNDPLDLITRDIRAAYAAAGFALPTITDRGPTSAEINAGPEPGILKDALYQCDVAIAYLVSNVERRPLDGRIPTGDDVVNQGATASLRAREARRICEEAAAAGRQPCTPAPPGKKSSSGGTIAAIGGAALVAGGLTWLLWPDAKQTIQPYARGKNDGRGYAAGIQARIGENQRLVLHQTDGPLENRFTGVKWEIRW